MFVNEDELGPSSPRFGLTAVSELVEIHLMSPEGRKRLPKLFLFYQKPVVRHDS